MNKYEWQGSIFETLDKYNMTAVQLMQNAEMSEIISKNISKNNNLLIERKDSE